MAKLISGSTVVRGMRLAALPAAHAGRTAVGAGKKLGGRPAEAVATEVQRRTAEQLFRTLGELKGGAMKLGQALSVFEALLPEELGAPYRAALTKLQDAAPPLPTRMVHAALAEQLGEDWRTRLVEFDDTARGAASIGQVHWGVWLEDGVRTEVAVKVQYPGVGKALRSDLRQLVRVAKLFSVLAHGVDVAGLAQELSDRIVEELDYRLEAANQTAFHEAFADAGTLAMGIVVPKVLHTTEKVLVTQWLEGKPLSSLIGTGTQEERDLAGRQLMRFYYMGQALAELLHADPHPGNFLVLPGGRLGALDFGAVKRLPGGIPRPMSEVCAYATLGDEEGVLAALLHAGLLDADSTATASEAMEFFEPLSIPFRKEEFHVTRAWLREVAVRIMDPRKSQLKIARSLRLTPEYFIVHRAATAVLGVLAQLDATVSFREEELLWSPGFQDVVAHSQPGTLLDQELDQELEAELDAEVMLQAEREEAQGARRA